MPCISYLYLDVYKKRKLDLIEIHLIFVNKVIYTFNIKILFIDEPEIQVEKAWVHADVGIEAEISCIVHAVPSAEVRITTVVYKKLFFKIVSRNSFFFYMIAYVFFAQQDVLYQFRCFFLKVIHTMN